MPVFNNILAGAAGQTGGAAAAAVATKSLRFNSGDSAYLNRTPSSAGNRKTFTFSCWVKLTKPSSTLRLLSAGTASAQISEIYYDSDKLRVFHYPGSSSISLVTTQVFRDFSAWHHVVVAVDTTQSTASNRVRLYVNGSEVTDFSTSTYPSQNTDTFVNGANAHYISAATGNSNAPQSGYYGDGYLADIYLIDGSQLDPTSFGAYDSNGAWQAASFSGTYGTNGFHLSFSDATNTTTIAEDSANNNDFTANNISVTAGAGNDSLFDVPTNGDQSDTGAGGEVSGNYATFNPLSQQYSTAHHVLVNGNLQHGDGSSEKGNYALDISTIAAPPSGKWYWEMTTDGNGTNERRMIGVMAADANFAQYIPHDNSTDGLVGIWLLTGQKIVNGSKSSYTSSFRAGNTVGVALDQDSQAVNFYLNGTALGSISLPSNMQGKSIVAAVSSIYEGENIIANFGQRPWAYSAPSNYKALCTTNLPTPTIADGSDYFDTTLYTGNNTSNRAITGLDFSPDFVWIKSRNLASGHLLFDTVRGAGEVIKSNNTNAELTQSNSLTAFNSDGFTIGSGTDSASINLNNITYVGWAWDAGSSTVSNSNGDITSSVRANQSAGFSIVSYTGDGSTTTWGHGLSVAPKLIFFKRRNNANNWFVLADAGIHSGFTIFEGLNNTNTGGDYSSNASASNTIVTLPNTTDWNTNGGTYIAYCFAPVAGYSAFGSYTGNASSDGPFVYTGMRPRWIMVKASSASGNWTIHDTARETYNASDSVLYPNVADAEYSNSGMAVDILSNGFKIRTGISSYQNSSGVTYVWAAFAENPLQANGGLAR